MVGVEVLSPHVQLAVSNRQVAAGDGSDQWILGQRELAELLRENVPEDPRGLQETGRLKFLVADDEDGVLDPKVAQRTPDRLGKVSAEVYTLDFDTLAEGRHRAHLQIRTQRRLHGLIPGDWIRRFCPAGIIRVQ